MSIENVCGVGVIHIYRVIFKREDQTNGVLGSRGLFENG